MKHLLQGTQFIKSRIGLASITEEKILESLISLMRNIYIYNILK